MNISVTFHTALRAVTAAQHHCEHADRLLRVALAAVECERIAGLDEEDESNAETVMASTRAFVDACCSLMVLGPSAPAELAAYVHQRRRILYGLVADDIGTIEARNDVYWFAHALCSSAAKIASTYAPIGESWLRARLGGDAFAVLGQYELLSTGGVQPTQLKVEGTPR